METTYPDHVRARVVHRCHICDGVIPAGSVYQRWASFDGGSAVTTKGHDACCRIYDAWRGLNWPTEPELMMPWDFQSEVLRPLVEVLLALVLGARHG